MAALSNFFPHPGSPFFLSLLPLIHALAGSFFPPQTRQDECHRVPCGPGTTPNSIGETDFRQPGHAVLLPKRGNEVDADAGGAVCGGRSYRLDVMYVPDDVDGEAVMEVVDGEWAGLLGDGVDKEVELRDFRRLTPSGGAHYHPRSASTRRN